MTIIDSCYKQIQSDIEVQLNTCPRCGREACVRKHIFQGGYSVECELKVCGETTKRYPTIERAANMWNAKD